MKSFDTLTMRQFNHLTKAFLTVLLMAGTLLSYGQNLEKFEADNGKYGFKDSSGKIIITAKYDDVFDFSEGLACVFVGKYDSTRHITRYKKPYHEDDFILSMYSKKSFYPDKYQILYGKFGFIDTLGNEVIKCKYDYAKDFHEGYAAVYKGDFDKHGYPTKGKWAYIDKTGTITIDYKYKDAKDFHGGLAPVKYGKKYGYINKKAELVIQCKYTDAESFSEDYAVVKCKKLYGVINKKGNLITPCKYNYIFLNKNEVI